MFKSLIRGSVSLLKWVLCGIGVLALVVLALLATPLQPVPELQSISRARATVDLSSLPAIERFQAREVPVTQAPGDVETDEDSTDEPDHPGDATVLDRPLESPEPVAAAGS